MAIVHLETLNTFTWLASFMGIYPMGTYLATTCGTLGKFPIGLLHCDYHLFFVCVVSCLVLFRYSSRIYSLYEEVLNAC